jgi:hypothetical protein
MNGKRNLTILFAATAATAAAVGMAPVALADPGTATGSTLAAAYTGTNAGFPAGESGAGTGSYTGPTLPPDSDFGAGPILGLRAGGTGSYTGPTTPPDAASGPGDQGGGQPAGAIG